jgi:hypothetical protein
MACVGTHHELIGVSGRLREDEPAITRTKVDRRRRMGGGQIGQLADVHLCQATSVDESHGRIIRRQLIGSKRAVKWRSCDGCSTIR